MTMRVSMIVIVAVRMIMSMTVHMRVTGIRGHRVLIVERGLMREGGRARDRRVPVTGECPWP